MPHAYTANRVYIHGWLSILILTLRLFSCAVLIGFEETSYAVDETDGVVRVAVAVMEGSGVLENGLVARIQIQLNTEMDTAQGNV